MEHSCLNSFKTHSILQESYEERKRVSRNLRNKAKKYFKLHKKQRLLIDFCVLLFLAILTTFSVNWYLGLKIISLTVQTDFQVQSENYYPNPLTIETNGPTYFNSYAQIHFSMGSRWGNIFKIFNVSASLDNSTWVNVPIGYNQSDLKNKGSANLGFAKLDSPHITIYLKTYLPPQNITVYSDATKEEIANANFFGICKITPIPSSLDTGKVIVTFTAVFGFISVIYNVFFKPKK